MKARHSHAIVVMLAAILMGAVPADAQVRVFAQRTEARRQVGPPTRADEPALVSRVAQRRDDPGDRDQPRRTPPPVRVPRVPQNLRNWPEVTEAFTRPIRLGQNGTFDLRNVSGDIVITGGRGEARIEAIKRVRTPSEAQARALLQQLQIDIVERGGNVDVRTLQPRGPAAFAQVDYTVSVPSGANVTVQTSGGNIRVTNVNGELRAESNSGDVTATGVRRVRVIKTMAGNIELADGESDELTASTMSGDVVIRNLKGRFFDLQTVTGTLRLVDVQPDRVNLRSMQGDIEYLGRLARSGRYEFLSHFGTIRLTPTGNQGFDIQANTFGGRFRSEYDLKIVQDSGDGRRPGPGGTRVIRATFGDAGAAITAHSFGGDIVILRR